MMVKIGDVWHMVTVEKPIMILFSDDDKAIVVHMPPEAKKLAYFADNDSRSKKEKLQWMEDGL